MSAFVDPLPHNLENYFRHLLAAEAEYSDLAGAYRAIREPLGQALLQARQMADENMMQLLERAAGDTPEPDAPKH